MAFYQCRRLTPVSVAWHEATTIDRQSPWTVASPSLVPPEYFIRFPYTSPVLFLYSWVEIGTLSYCSKTLQNDPGQGSNSDFSFCIIARGPFGKRCLILYFWTSQISNIHGQIITSINWKIRSDFADNKKSLVHHRSFV